MSNVCVARVRVWAGVDACSAEGAGDGPDPAGGRLGITIQMISKNGDLTDVKRASTVHSITPLQIVETTVLLTKNYILVGQRSLLRLAGSVNCCHCVASRKPLYLQLVKTNTVIPSSVPAKTGHIQHICNLKTIKRICDTT